MSKNQRNTTDLEEIKRLAKTLLHMEPEPVEQMPIFVRHPFTSSGFVGLRDTDGSLRISNIIECQSDRNQWRQQMTEIINDSDSAMRIYHLVEKQYLLGFFKYAAPFLSQEDYAGILADAWIRCEEPNHDPNLSQNKLLAMFRRADPMFLMNDQERMDLEELPDPVTVYRGVRSNRGSGVRALSWTLEPQTAQWFANRYGRQGQVYEAKISKQHIYALFHGRGESEIILNPKHLMELTQVQQMAADMKMEGM